MRLYLEIPMRFLKLMLMFFFLFAQMACVTRGHNFPSELSWLKTKQTTQSQVAEKLGAPHRVGSSSGTPTWTYAYYQLSLFEEDNIKELTIYWTGDRTVDRFSFTSSFPSDRSQSMRLAK